MANNKRSKQLTKFMRERFKEDMILSKKISMHENEYGSIPNIYEDEKSGWYRGVDVDEFPIPQYVQSKTKRPITHSFRLDHKTGSQICHKLEDLERILKIYPFQKIYSFDSFENESRTITTRNVYEFKDDVGIILLIASGIPTYFNKKSKKREEKLWLALFSNGEETTYEKIRAELINSYKKIPYTQNNVNLVISSPHGYDTEEFDLPKQKIDIPLNYGKDFVPVHKKIIESLNQQKSKGLVLLHGDPGTGKTHYLKYIASKVKDKKVLFIPPYLADFITSPEMTPFLIENSNSVLFIEDAERVITDRSETGSSGVSNILNITDGILSDILNIQIVATFNMDRQKIDPALLRKGRLIAEHKFGPLSTEDSNALIKELGLDYTATKPMTLTEIYNCKDEHYVSESTDKRRIGFGTN